MTEGAENQRQEHCGPEMVELDYPVEQWYGSPDT